MCAKSNTPGHDPPRENFSFGRTVPKNDTEKTILEKIKLAPSLGKELRIKLNDPNCSAVEGWVKMEYKEKNVIIHYVYNIWTQIAKDFKFK